MNILVTGGAGYIGSVTVESLIARGHQVVVLDNLSTGHREAVHPDAAFVHGDVSDADMVAYALVDHEVEAVLHFAAHSLVGESMKEPLKYFANNTAGTLSLLEAMLGHGVQKFVLSSTAALFGTPEKQPITEEARLQPASVYGESKYLIERMLYWLQQTQGLGYVALRYFNAAGASETFGEDHRPESHLIPLVLQVAQGKRDKIGIFGNDYDTPDGTCIRDYIHVQDLAKAHILAVEALKPNEGRAYNLGNGQGFSVQEVILACRKVTGQAINTEVLLRRAGDPATLIADSSLITRELAWQPHIPKLTDIVRSAWLWQQAHPEGYKS